MEVDSDGEEEAEELPTLASDEAGLLKTLGVAPVRAAAATMSTFAMPKAKETTATPEEEVAKACGANSLLI